MNIKITYTKNLNKKDFEIARNIFNENKKILIKNLDFIGKNKFIYEEIKKSIIGVLKNYKIEEKEEFLEIFGEINLEYFFKDFFFEIKEYRFLRREYSKDIIFRIYTEIFSKKYNFYKISYNLDFNSDFEIIDDWLYL